MLETRKTVDVRGISTIDGVVVKGFNATIDGLDINISSWVDNKEMYAKADVRKQVRTDEAEFEEFVYSMVEEENNAAE